MSWFEKYRRHKLNSVYLNSDEFNRLRGLSSSAPGPTLWGVVSLPPFDGSDGLELRWRKSDHAIVLGNGERREDYLAAGFGCYVLPLTRDQLCLWYHASTETAAPATSLFRRHVFRGRRHLKFHGLRLILIGTSLLKPLTTIPDLEGRRKTGNPPVEFVSGLVAETEFPIPGRIGKFAHQFPDAMHSIRELLVLGSVLDRPRSQGIYVMKPREGTIEVLPMDWWNNGDYDFGYEWVTKIARDPNTRNIVGEGVRILPFLLDQSGNFLGWMEESK